MGDGVGVGGALGVCGSGLGIQDFVLLLRPGAIQFHAPPYRGTSLIKNSPAP